MANAKQITTMQAYQKAERLGYIAKLSPDGDVIHFYTGEADKPGTWLSAGRAKIRNGCVDAITVSLLIGTEA